MTGIDYCIILKHEKLLADAVRQGYEIPSRQIRPANAQPE